MGEIDDLTNRLYEMEHAKDAAVSQLKEREWELTNKISQLEAELSAAMEGLGAEYLESGCKPPKDWRIGTEHEKFGFNKDTLKPLPYEGHGRPSGYLKSDFGRG